MMQKFGLRFKLCALIAPPLLVLGVIAVQGLLLSLNGAGPDLESDVRTLAILALATFLLSGLMVITVGRALLTPLEQATDAAKELSQTRLPQLLETLRNPSSEVPAFQPLVTEESGELGELVQALNDVQESVVTLATEQQSIVRSGLKDLVVNMARRNQSLLDRQIEVIDRVESSEEDPGRLEDLYNLDHLATRMRRNAESLLVLAGADPARRRGGPVAVSDVMRVAMSEIEDYRHIELQEIEQAKLGPQNAVDLAHLASELMENATQFSPPESSVEVRGAQHPDGSYLISITDSGIGMEDAALESANEILRTPPELGLGLSRSLGFIVVGRLAKRLGVRVELARGAAAGITAIIEVPASTLYGYTAPTPEAEPAQELAGAEQPVQQSNDLALLDTVEPEATQPPSSLDDALARATDDVSADSAMPLATEPMAPEHESLVSPSLSVDPLESSQPAEESWTPPAMPERGTPLTPSPARAENNTMPSGLQAGAAHEATLPAPAGLDGAPSDALAKLLGMAPGAVSGDPFEATTPDASAAPVADPFAPPAPEAFTAPQADAFTAPEPAESWADRVEADGGDPDWVEPVFDPTLLSTDTDLPVGEVAPAIAETAPALLADALPPSGEFESSMADLLKPPPDTTSTGLIKRDRTTSQAPVSTERPVAASVRSPEEIRSMLARYRDGLKGNPGAMDRRVGESALTVPDSMPPSSVDDESSSPTSDPFSNPSENNPFGDPS